MSYDSVRSAHMIINSMLLFSCQIWPKSTPPSWADITTWWGRATAFMTPWSTRTTRNFTPHTSGPAWVHQLLTHHPVTSYKTPTCSCQSLRGLVLYFSRQQLTAAGCVGVSAGATWQHSHSCDFHHSLAQMTLQRMNQYIYLINNPSHNNMYNSQQWKNTFII